MKSSWLRTGGRVVAATLLTAMVALQAAPAAAAPWDGTRRQFADARFDRIWTRTDSSAVRSGRTWYWGPNPWFDYAEFLRQGENGLRTVQYFDKARMEINNPNDRSGANEGVTNGLLVKELISGRLQLGNDPYDVEQRAGADVPVAGNPRDANDVAPGYASFAGVATVDNGYRDPQRLGERISVTIDRSGNLGVRPELARPETEIVQYNSITGHNIPRVFWDFLNLQGPIVANGRVQNGPVVEWIFAMGLPISDAYWTRAQIGNQTTDVLVQLFERRVLTYVPSNPDGYKVEMGNVGQHYFQWRYPHLGQPWVGPEPVTPLLFASDRDTGGDHWELYMYNQSISNRITSNAEETVAFSWRRSWDPGQMRLLVDSRRAKPEYRQIYEFDPPAFYDGDKAWNAGVRRISYSDGTQPPPDLYPGWLPFGVANDYNPSYSPDGTKIAFVSDRIGNGSQELMIVPATGYGPTQLTNNGCVNETPTWSPDGRRLYWASNCDGDFDIYSAAIRYLNDSIYGISAELTDVRNLTNNNSNDRFARLSPDGRWIAFSSDRESGQWDLFMVNAGDGSGERRLTGSSGNDEAPTWSPDGTMIAFASDRDGDYEIYQMNLNSIGNETRLTDNNWQDRWPLWAQ
ncbi:MAG: hypothetical protein HC822_21560 [Oscillochloris sp.]|nr:hypothetical protein [Oscillochloris sp.]